MIYSGWVTYNGYNFFRTGIEVSTSSSNTSVTITVKTYIQLASGSHEGFWNFNGRANAGGGYTGYVSGSSAYLQDTANHKISSASHTVSRTHANQTISVAGQAYDSYLSTGTGTASSSVTVSPRTSYAITYNANGGSGAPAAQTKWYDEAITLQKGVPTRTNYEFLGWSTNKGATAADSAYTKAKMTDGVNYTGNAALTLYAVWKLAFVAPTISSFSAYRSDSSGNADPSSTEYLTFKCVWSFNQTGGTNNSGSVKFTYGSTSTTVTISGATSGTATKTVSGTFTDAYSVTALLTDNNGLTATKSTRVPTIWRPFTMRKTGTNAASAAFFGLADVVSQNILKIFGRLWIEGRQETWVSGVQGNAAINFYKKVLNANSWNPSLMFQTKGGGAWEVGNHDGEELRFVYFTATKIANSTNTADATITLNSNGTITASKAWAQLATAKSGTAMTFTLPTNCTEVMVAAICTTTSSSVRVYAGSVVIPRALLSTTNTEWLLGGGSVGSTTSSSGTRYCAVQITTTKATGVGAYSDGTNHASTTTFYVYAR